MVAVDKAFKGCMLFYKTKEFIQCYILFTKYENHIYTA